MGPTISIGSNLPVHTLTIKHNYLEESGYVYIVNVLGVDNDRSI